MNTKDRNSIYCLTDNMFRFWYRFVPRHISQIQSGMGETVYDRIEPQITAYMGEIFEEICKQYLWRENAAHRLPFIFREAGRWWGTDAVKKTEKEIDIIAFDDTRAIFCECKWTNEPVGLAVLDGLMEKCEMFHFREKYYYLFSKTGYTENCLKKADDRVRLIAFGDMFTRV